MRSSGLEPPRAVKPTRPSTSNTPARCLQERGDRSNRPLPRTHRTHLDQRVLPRRCQSAQRRSRAPQTQARPPLPGPAGAMMPPHGARSQFASGTVAARTLTTPGLHHRRPRWLPAPPRGSRDDRGDGGHAFSFRSHGNIFGWGPAHTGVPRAPALEASLPRRAGSLRSWCSRSRSRPPWTQRSVPSTARRSWHSDRA